MCMEAVQKRYVLGSNEAVYWFQSFLLQWKTLGWNSIIYMAAISGIDQEQYEAARVDGAGYLQCALHVTLPAMMETFVVLFILNVGNFLNTGYEQYLLFKNSLTAPNIEVLDLYTYRILKHVLRLQIVILLRLYHEGSNCIDML